MRRSSLAALLAIAALTTACGSSSPDAPTLENGSAGPSRSPNSSTPPDSNDPTRSPEDPKPDPNAETIVRVHYPEGKGDMNITGDVGSLSSTPAPMKKTGSNTWEMDLGVLSAVSHVHPQLGDKPSLGPDYSVQPGQTLDIYPHFTQRKGMMRQGNLQSKIHTKVAGGTRTVEIYLPPTYIENTEARFPVIYVIDPQGYFGTAPNTFQDMLADDAIEAAADSGKFAEAILVGVDTLFYVGLDKDFGYYRMLELTPTSHNINYLTGQETPGDYGEGPHFLEMVTKELKPLIDEQLRTLPDKKHTHLSGFSLGGLMAMYGGAVHSDVFGGVVSFSGSAWWDRKSVVQNIKDMKNGPFKVYADVGDAEGTDPDSGINVMVESNTAAFKAYEDAGYVQGKTLMTQVCPGGTHDGGSWAKRLPDAFAFALGPGR